MRIKSELFLVVKYEKYLMSIFFNEEKFGFYILNHVVLIHKRKP